MSQTLPHTRIEAATPAFVAEAGAMLRAGQLVAFPTETVYGLGGDATNDHAVAAIFAAKGRPSFNPLIVHVAKIAEAETLVRIDARARALMAQFWPGPLTLVLPRAAGSPISLLASAGLDTIAIRLPAHDVARAVIRAAGRPIAAPSANRSGAVSPTTAAHVGESLGGRIGLILDGGPCRVGVESTVLDLSGPAPCLLRPGGITAEQIEAVLAQKLSRPTAHSAAPKSPGMLESHYAPSLAVRLNAATAANGEALLGFGPMACTRNLSEQGDLEEAAANLFAALRALDDPAFTAIAVAPIPENGLGCAINDRLRRAAAPRS
ncbi:L-threonylcarbamoyladenylate synthase [Magnetospirillum sulfuroxidans]|uniref:Threonylcarbamoyl-AMP synthase n=1 Tax=Magnetospirillum sulfuroxidans TaxID=611300 RepID=A0ABS5IFT1_9PROT|nr:L-threonylcarbamoyladenylate synthase [Magnetospirillum sulfuroxidans]MBR9973288.1 threonylcarbamoyl-AMP synthase [Magnetospirillum sulfuroxidans]